MMSPIVFCQVSLCFFMTGLIWLIQTVHYPAFRFVGEDQFETFHLFHSQKITRIVAPAMLGELVTAVTLTRTEGGVFWIANLIGVVLIWASTALLSIPLHNRLAHGKSDTLIARLVATNWPRTALWSARSLAFLWWLLWDV